MAEILNIAHRGARSLAPENTIAAARKGLEVGADMWELDVRLTADDEPVLMHDRSLRRTSDVEVCFPHRQPWSVSDFTLAEVQSLDCGSWYNSDDPFGQVARGVVSPEDRDSYRREQAPTLQEALVFTDDSDWRVNVELKRLPTDEKGAVMVQRAVALIDTLGIHDRVLVSSFDHGYLRQVRELSARIETAALVALGFRRPTRLLASIDAQALHPWNALLRARRVRVLREAGFGVNVWTVNDENTMRKLIRMGVSGIITDFPQTLSRVLTND
jgi:glycerophosphoryl diester phosphodiesterase